MSDTPAPLRAEEIAELQRLAEASIGIVDRRIALDPATILRLLAERSASEERVRELEQELQSREDEYYDYARTTEGTIIPRMVAAEARLREAEGLLRSVVRSADLGQWRDSTHLSFAAHPVVDQIRAFISSQPTAKPTGPAPGILGESVD